MRGWRQAAAPAATAPQLAHATKNCRRYRQSPDTGLRATESWQCLPSHAPLRRQSRHAVAPAPEGRSRTDRKSVVKGKSGSVRVDLGGRRTIKKKKQTT